MVKQPHYSYTSDQFLGAIILSYPEGFLYPTHTQTAALTLSAEPYPEAGGWALIPIVASGDAITVPADWILYGGDEISIVAGDTNHIQVYYKDADTIYYTNKVVTP